jgi:hypothetical protein
MAEHDINFGAVVGKVIISYKRKAKKLYKEAVDVDGRLPTGKSAFRQWPK